jgi:hypothetical protein
MAAKLRPEWPARSVRTYLEAKHADRAYADLAVALAVVCTDPTAETPARLEQHGPWWTATRVLAGTGRSPDVGPGRGQPRCGRPGHEHEHAEACRLCRAERLTGTTHEPQAPTVPAPADWRKRRPAATPTDRESQPA